MTRDLVLWDRDCGFCRRGVVWAERRDQTARLRFEPYQESTHPSLDEGLRLACARAMHVIRADGSVLRGGRAALFVLERAGWRGFARVFGIPPLVWMVEAGYWIVARNRRFFSRFLFRRSRG